MENNNKYKHVIWDWNGTMFNDVKLCVDVGNNLFRKKNIPLMSLEKYRSIFTIPVRDYYIAAGFDFSKESFEIIGKEWMNEYEERKYESTLYDGLVKVMRKLSKDGIKQSVVSAYKQDRLNEMINEFKINEYLDHIVGLDNIYAAGKLHLAKNLMQKLDNGHEETLLIGDTIHDYEVAIEIGADCILISEGHQAKEKLNETGAQIYESLHEFYNSRLS